MLCSSCHTTIHPVVVLDIDGTLGDYHGHFHNFAEAYLGTTLRPYYDGSCELHDWYGMSLERYREIKLSYRQGGMKRSMPIFHRASAMVRQLRIAGVEVWFCTTRPYLRLDNIDPDTREWLSRHMIDYDGLLYSENKYDRLLEIVDTRRIVAVLDDLPEMCIAAHDKIGPGVPLLKVAPHNEYYRRQDAMRSDVRRFPAIADMDAALDILLYKLQYWRRTEHA